MPDESRLKELWERGVPVREIAREIGRSPSYVSIHARRIGLSSRQLRPSDNDRAEFSALYGSGETIADVARRAGYHRDTVRRSLIDQGVELRGTWRKWPVRHDAFSPPLSSEGWYWLGFLAADGYVRNTAVTLIQKRASEPVLRRFLTYMGSAERPLREGGNGPALVAQIHSPQVVVDLARHGVVHRKSYSLRTSSQASKQAMFWLGVFDGDGSIGFNSRNAPIISLVGTRSLMLQYSDFLQSVIGRRPAVGRHHGCQTLWSVRASGDSARQVAELWLRCSDISLEAKRSRLEQAAHYSSRVTHARLACRRRRCDYCGAWVERLPSQFREHVFCDSVHFGKWNRSRQLRR